MTATNSSEASSGMPQLDFSTFPNQAFWLLVTVFCLFLMVRLLIIPRMDNILANRRKVIEEDLVGAEKFRDSAENLKNSITEEIDLARMRAGDILNKSKDKTKLNVQKGIIEAAEMTSKLLLDSEKIIRKMQHDADNQVDKITAELVPEIVTKIFPLKD